MAKAGALQFGKELASRLVNGVLDSLEVRCVSKRHPRLSLASPLCVRVGVTSARRFCRLEGTSWTLCARLCWRASCRGSMSG
jgi:hypothetical protein